MGALGGWPLSLQIEPQTLQTGHLPGDGNEEAGGRSVTFVRLYGGLCVPSVLAMVKLPEDEYESKHSTGPQELG